MGFSAPYKMTNNSKALEMAKALKNKGIDTDIIAETSGLTKEEIEQL